ncbi:MAG: ABC transporter ATP-binding protein [Selenomonadaceae bacterium]|nr:ABC transporter ATP-binding protein [Selenomonadaceae bacterium]
MTILDVRHVKKIFGDKTVLDDINFSVDAGEILAIIGLSGCGKSTLAKIISRLIDCDGGKIFLCGEDITHSTDNNFYRDMQMIFQMPEDSFDPRRTLGASIAEPIKNFGVKASVSELLTRVGLPNEYSERYPREVSGGECQRAAIARAISVEPKLLICDEATSALDVTIQAQIIALIKNLCVERQISCIFITHDLKIVKKIADRVLVLENGKLKTFSASIFGRKFNETSA